MSATAAPEVVSFLAEHPPFDALAAEDLQRVAGAVEIESHRAGESIFSQGARAVEHLRVVRRGAVEIVADGRVLDLLGEGEMFGHASMLSGYPTEFEARAAEEDTQCYRISAPVAERLLSGPEGLRYVARSLLSQPVVAGDREHEPFQDPSSQPVGALIRSPPVVCEPDTPIRDAARLMTAGHSTSLVVKHAGGALGIVTDHDLRTRVLAEGLPADAPVSAAMTTPAHTCSPERPGGEVLLDMLDRGFHHFPVVTADGEVLGVVEDMDLLAVHARSWFFLRRRISNAHSVDELVGAAAELRPTVIALHDARVAAVNTMAVYAVVVDALTRRLLELALASGPEPQARFAWLALGSQARREALPSSDMDSAIVWFGELEDNAVRPALQTVARAVVEGLERCGLAPDAHGATASDPLFIRPLASWQRAVRSWIADPTQEKALILVSVLVDSRPVWGLHTGTPVADTFRLAPSNPALLRMLARFALSHRPPTGFLRGLVVEHTGEHRGRLDLKHGGMTPIVDLARWAGMAAGLTSASTSERLNAAQRAGVLSAAHARNLLDAFDLITDLRLGHQVSQLRAGVAPDDYVDPAELSSLTRSHLREAFRAVTAVQKRVAADLSAGLRWQ
jgi:CBS domain-containing protein